jgi:hypothetical protein
MFSRQKLLLQQQQNASDSANHVKGGFGGLTRTVLESWHKLDLAYKIKLDNLVEMDKIRHAREMKAWNASKASPVTYIKKSGEDEVKARIHEIAQEEATAPTRGCNGEFEARAVGVLKSKVSLSYTPSTDTKLTSIASELFALSHRPPSPPHLQNLQLKNTPKSSIGFYCPVPGCKIRRNSDRN